MFRKILIFGLVVVVNAQVLRISPQIIGSTTPGTLQVIQLNDGGSRPTNVHLVPESKPVVHVESNSARFIDQPAVIIKPQLVRFNSAVESNEHEKESFVPVPWGFGFDSEDEFGTKLGRKESSNEQGIVTGTYTYSDASGLARIVNYIADESGFRATAS
ncbi:hypothetical protein RDWZM_008282 [Blomia tropicalis]|uniref:Uncharacterized protein n=1 Tax=Blomia tropicalis TaxID=40697 RepID=A0A9Q0M0Q2_BLOTA|nr:hypothetical protein RDWZM_008282 [Blomia tropicalis]